MPSIKTYFCVYFKGSPTVSENTQFAAPKRPNIPPVKAETLKVPLGEMQQDSEDDGQDNDNEFPESDEMNQTGFPGEKTQFPRSVNMYRGSLAERLERRT